MWWRPEIARFWRLAPAERGLFLRAWAWLLVVRVALRLGTLARVQRMLRLEAAHGTPADAAADAAARARRVARIVEAANRRSAWRASCLPRSLVLQRLLLAQGLSADLRVGVRKGSDGALDAHAWVEHGGEPLIDDARVGERFMPFSGPIGAGRDLRI